MAKTEVTDPTVAAAATAIAAMEQGVQRTFPRHKTFEEFYDPEGNLVSVARWESQIPNRKETPVRVTINSGLSHDDSDVWLDDEQAVVLALGLLRAMSHSSREVRQARLWLRKALPKTECDE